MDYGDNRLDKLESVTKTLSVLEGNSRLFELAQCPLELRDAPECRNQHHPSMWPSSNDQLSCHKLQYPSKWYHCYEVEDKSQYGS